MRILCIGGGPAGLYLAMLMKKADPRHVIRVVERNRPDDTFGWGVVFSDQTLGNLEAADAETAREIAGAFNHWDDIDVHFRAHDHLRVATASAASAASGCSTSCRSAARRWASNSSSRPT